MRTIGLTLVLLMGVLILITADGQAVQAGPAAAPLAQQVTATPRATVYPAGKAGTVLAARLNVRAGASAAQRQIGVLARGARVQVLKRQGDWLQIVFQGGPGGAGWVSSRYVAVDGEPTSTAPVSAGPTATRSAASPSPVAAPRSVSYLEPIFTWEWNGLNQAASVPWYFDIQIYSRSGSDPYDVMSATLAQVRQENGFWKFDRLYHAQCDSYWVVQIAQGAPGNFQGWISNKSNRQPIGESCPAPTPDCQNCGG